jgi:ribosome maturation factor RimP
MTTARQKVQERVADLVAPIIKELGLALVDVEYSRQGAAQVLRIFIEREGGVTVDELQAASRILEKTLEVEEILSGRYRLEVSSPGIDRPLKRPADFRKRIGERIRLKAFSSLPDGKRRLKGTLLDASDDEILLEADSGDRLAIPYREISSAAPEIDWNALLKKASSADKQLKKDRRKTP